MAGLARGVQVGKGRRGFQGFVSEIRGRGQGSARKLVQHRCGTLKNQFVLAFGQHFFEKGILRKRL